MNTPAAAQAPVILFGAFDRHNFGDLLFPHVAAALLPDRDLVYAGLASRDLRPFGGHVVQALDALAAERGGRPAALMHVGGEILSCAAWQAAVMLLGVPDVQATIAYLAEHPAQRLTWLRRALGTTALAPYVVSRARLPGLARVVYAGVGGIGLDRCEPALRAEVLATLAEADDVAVRDRQTLAQLHAAGVPARLTPDPVVMVAELFDARIRERARDGEVADVARTFPQGYLALQFSAEFSDDATLAQIAVQCDRAAAACGAGVVLFRAGAAPWHDELDALQRVAARMNSPLVRVFRSLDIWDICALIVGCRACCSSSLHGRIVAMAFARPRVNLRPPAATARDDKVAAFAATWEAAGQVATVDVPGIAAGVAAALAVAPARLQDTARRLARSYREGFAATRVALARDAGTQVL